MYGCPMEFPRLPRFSRVPTIAPIQLTDRDRQILRLVHRHRFLRSSHIMSLVGGSAQGVARRLQTLYHHGFLERPRAQIDYYYRGGSRHIVYGLGNKGLAVLKRTPRLRRDRRWGERNRSVGRVFLEHALFVSEVMVAIELACRTHDRIRFIPCEELRSETVKQQPFRWWVDINKSMKLGVVPDHVFALESRDLAGAATRAYFFLEADRGTMPVTRRRLSQTSFYRKLVAYEATWMRKMHQTLFGFHRFRVLAITQSKERLNSLVVACSRLKSGRGLFLFADRTILEKPNNPLTGQWVTGRPGKTASLLD